MGAEGKPRCRGDAMSNPKITVHKSQILQIMPAPGRLLQTKDGNIYAGFALVELDLEWEDGSLHTLRDILPFGTDGGIIGSPGDSYYQLHALGDYRPPYADTEFPSGKSENW